MTTHKFILPMHYTQSFKQNSDIIKPAQILILDINQIFNKNIEYTSHIRIYIYLCKRTTHAQSHNHSLAHHHIFSIIDALINAHFNVINLSLKQENDCFSPFSVSIFLVLFRLLSFLFLVT